MKLLNLSYFFLGILFVLIIFQVNIPFLPIFQINFTLTGSLPEWLTAIGTIAAVIVALAISIIGKSLGELFYTSDIKILEPLENTQPEGQITTGQTRLLIKNYGNTTAEGVEVYVNRLLQNGRPRRNYLPVPLYWTHNGSKRDFHPKQFGYLDLCRRCDINKPNEIPKLVLAAGAGVSTYENINQGETDLELVIFQKSGQVINYKISLTWRINQPFAHVTNIQKL